VEGKKVSRDLAVGGRIWYFDSNRRVYPPLRTGQLWPDSGPIYREHWVAVEIKGETTRSWITCYGKCPKKGHSKPWALYEEEVDADCYIHNYRYIIARKVEHLTFGEYDTFDVYLKLRNIAGIIGYDDGEKK